MLRISSIRAHVRPLWVRAFSGKVPEAYVEFKNLMAENKKAFPGLYPSEKEDIATQQKLIDHAWNPQNLEKNVSTYNAAYQNLVENWGLDGTFAKEGFEKMPAFLKLYLKDLDLEFLQENKPKPEPMPTEPWHIFDKKMGDAQELVDKLLDSFKETADTPQTQRLLLAKRDQCKADLKSWFRRCEHADEGPKTFSGLPFDSQMMEQVFADIRHEKLKGRQDWLALSDKQKDEFFEEITTETWATMYEKVVKFTQPDRTEEEFEDLKRVYFDTLNPRDISVSNIKDLSKVLFLSAYWAGGDKTIFKVEEDIQRFKDLIENIPQDVTELWKESLREKPNLKIKGEIAGFIKTLDYAFIPKVLNEIRMAHCKAHYHRAANRVLTAAHEDDYRIRQEYFNTELAGLPDLEETKQNLREQVVEFADLVDGVIFAEEVIRKQMAELKEQQQQRLDMSIPSTEEMVKEVVAEALWCDENDARRPQVEAFTQKLLQYLKSGKGDMVALETEAKSLFPPANATDVGTIDYSEAFNAYVRAHRRRMDLWSFREIVYAQAKKNEAKIFQKRSVVMSFMKDFDESLCRLLKHVIETGNVALMMPILDDYGKLVKRHKGEVYGTVVSASDLSQADFDQIVSVLTKQNPGKKFFLSHQVDANLGAGFVVKCGPHSLDYSLGAETKALKSSLEM